MPDRNLLLLPEKERTAFARNLLPLVEKEKTSFEHNFLLRSEKEESTLERSSPPAPPKVRRDK